MLSRRRRFHGAAIALAGIVCAPAGSQTISPSHPEVAAGQSIKLKADRAVAWSLVPGSVGRLDPDGTYHAPAHLAPPKAVGGCQIGPLDSVFNARVDGLAVHANSNAWIAALPSQTIQFDPAFGINIADNGTPFRSFSFRYTPEANGVPFQVPVWPELKRESGIFSDPLTEVDRHILTVNKETCDVYEIYNDYPAGTQGASPPESIYTAQSGLKYSALSYDLPPHGSTSASGMPLVPLILNLDDIRSGEVRHALMVTFSNAYILPSAVWPATAHAGSWGAIPYGTRFRLKANFDVAGFSPIARIILKGLKDYGMFLADGGANWDIVTSTDLTADRAVAAALSEIHNGTGLNKNQFEIVDESALMVAPLSSAVAIQNTNLRFPVYAIAKAEDGVHPPVTARIALRGVALNSPEGGGVWIQSGVAATLNVLLGGTSEKSVTWKMVPSLGSLDPVSGKYSAPAVTAPATAMVTATSNFDAAASVTFPVTVLPPGVIRIAAGDASANPASPHSHAPDYGPDSQGNMWWRDQAGERSWGVRNDYWYPPSHWPAAPDIYRYQTQFYSLGDTVYRFLLSNGDYAIDYYAAQGDCPSGNIEPMRYREHLESQGQIAAYDFRPLSTVGGKCYTPIHTSIPARVTDNRLYFAVRRITDHTQPEALRLPVTILSAFSITPVQGRPRLTIDPPSPEPLTISQRLQLHAIGWFLSNKVRWTLASGPGELSPEGLYVAPSQPVSGIAEIRATSLADQAQTATVRLRLVPGRIAVSPDPLALDRSATRQLHASIGGKIYSAVNWSISPQIGRIDASGLFTAPDILDQDTVVTVTAAAADKGAEPGTSKLIIRAAPAPIRINCGDNGSLTDAQGRVWATDFGFSQPSIAYGLRVPIAGAPPDLQALYQSARYSGYDSHDFSYAFPLPDGEYRVTLKFADYGSNPAGHFLFDVKANGSVVMKQFDPVAVAGSRTAVDRTFVVDVKSKVLRLEFIGGQHYAIVNGIEITSAGSGAVP